MYSHSRKTKGDVILDFADTQPRLPIAARIFWWLVILIGGAIAILLWSTALDNLKATLTGTAISLPLAGMFIFSDFNIQSARRILARQTKGEKIFPEAVDVARALLRAWSGHLREFAAYAPDTRPAKYCLDEAATIEDELRRSHYTEGRAGFGDDQYPHKSA